MAVDQTIPGGAYQNADGSWVDANGKPLKGKPAELEKLEKEQAEEVQRLDREAQKRALLAQGVVMTTASLDDYAAPQEPVTEGDKPGAKKVSSKKG